MGRQPLEADLIFGIVFLAVCNTVLYGLVVYGSLLAISLMRRKPAVGEAPPPPNLFRRSDI